MTERDFKDEAWFHGIAEVDHEIQNPTSPEKIRLLGGRLRLGPESELIDIACGKAGPAVILASSFGCRIVGVERAPVFLAAARERIAEAGLDELVEIREQDASAIELEPESWDAALCLGATFVFGGTGQAARKLVPSVRIGGHVVLGEVYWREWPLPTGISDQGFVDLEATVARLEAAGLSLVSIIASSEDDWDAYESLHWQAIERWLDEHPEHSASREIQEEHERYKAEYIRSKRALWAGRC